MDAILTKYDASQLRYGGNGRIIPHTLPPVVTMYWLHCVALLGRTAFRGLPNVSHSADVTFINTYQSVPCCTVDDTILSYLYCYREKVNVYPEVSREGFRSLRTRTNKTKQKQMPRAAHKVPNGIGGMNVCDTTVVQ